MPERVDVEPGSPGWLAARRSGVTGSQVLHDDCGDAITVCAEISGPPALLVTFWASPFHGDGDAFMCMRLSGERLAAFTEALDRHAAYIAGHEGDEDE